MYGRRRSIQLIGKYVNRLGKNFHFLNQMGIQFFTGGRTSYCLSMTYGIFHGTDYRENSVLVNRDEAQKHSESGKEI